MKFKICAKTSVFFNFHNPHNVLRPGKHKTYKVFETLEKNILKIKKNNSPRSKVIKL